MPVWKVKYICGCGFKADDADKAEGHCKNTAHRIAVQGTVEPDAEDVNRSKLRKMKPY